MKTPDAESEAKALRQAQAETVFDCWLEDKTDLHASIKNMFREVFREVFMRGWSSADETPPLIEFHRAGGVEQ